MTDVKQRIKKIEAAIEELSMVYEDEARDNVPDNGNLENLHKAVLHASNARILLQKRLV